MPGPARAGAVLFAKDVADLVRFYESVLGMTCVHQDADHAVIENPDLQLVVHGLPDHIAQQIALSTPPTPRAQVPVKLFASVADLDAALEQVHAGGGVAVGAAWQGPGFRAVDVADAEGNVVQLRAWPE